MSRLSNYTSRPTSANVLKEGTHNVRLIKAIETNSFNSFDGELKDKLPQWSNPSEQFLIQVANDKGVLTHRLQLQGWMRFAELTDEQIKSGKFINVEGYACADDAQGNTVRLEDEYRSDQCMRIFDRFMSAIGCPVGSGIEAIDDVIANHTMFTVVVVNDEYEGKDQLRISSFKPLAKVQVEEFDDMER